MPVYTSIADKARKYVRETIPQIFEAALNAATGGTRAYYVLRMFLQVSGLDGVIRGREKLDALHLAGLHEALKRRGYVSENEAAGARDDVQDVRTTLIEGGDCEDYAAVVLGVARMLGIPAVLEMAGSRADRFEHARVLVKLGRWYVIDPKGDEVGAEFDVRDGEFEVLSRWELDPGGRVRECN